jgi:hypothetical protein
MRVRIFCCSVQHPRYVGDAAADEVEDEVDDWVDDAEVRNDELENEDDVDVELESLDGNEDEVEVELEALDGNEDEIEVLEAAAEVKYELDELEDDEVVDEDKVVDAAAEGAAEQLAVTVTVTVLTLEHSLMVMVLGKSALPETRVERVTRPMAKEWIGLDDNIMRGLKRQ